MPMVTRGELKSKAQSKGFTKAISESHLIKKAHEYTETKTYDIFISHSHLDADEIYILSEEIEAMGFSVYVDWKEDNWLDRNKVTKEAAEKLRTKMKQCKSLFLITTDNSIQSRWCPWELGFFDGYKGKVAIMPVLGVLSANESYNGVEYLGIYPYATIARDTNNIETVMINDSKDTYVTLKQWLSGYKPYKRR